MLNTARIVSVEGGALVERQTSAVLGDIKKLTAQIQAAVGTDATSLEEVRACATPARQAASAFVLWAQTRSCWEGAIGGVWCTGRTSHGQLLGALEQVRACMPRFPLLSLGSGSPQGPYMHTARVRARGQQRARLHASLPLAELGQWLSPAAL